MAVWRWALGSDIGERVTAFPSDEDYEEDLKSQIADIKQCTLEGGPDHIHATRFLGRFVENKVPWLHVDLSSSNRKGVWVRSQVKLTVLV